MSGWTPVRGRPGVVETDVRHVRTRLGGAAFALLRHLFVGGVRAPRTAEPGSGVCNSSATSTCGFTKTLWGAEPWGCGIRAHGGCQAQPPPRWCRWEPDCPAPNASGYTLSGPPAAAALGWPRGGQGVEFVYRGVAAKWAEPRCSVDRVLPLGGGAVFIAMAQPCFAAWVHKCHERHLPGALPPTGIENVGWKAGGAAVPGTWYLDSEAGVLQYAPRPGEDMAAAEVVLPLLEQLVAVRGLEGGLRFTGLSFQHNGWRRPGSDEGFVENQSGVDAEGRMTPAAVAVWNSTGVVFHRCEFRRLGSAGLGLGGGTASSRADACRFEDISSAAFQAGCASCKRGQGADVNNSLSDSVVERAAAELHGAAAVFVPYAAATRITHNTITNVSYVPISVGWGWRSQTSIARDNIISGNRISYYKMLLNDGGCIYTLDVQPGTQVSRNWCSHQGTASEGGLYPDNGSSNMSWTQNVLSDMGASNWLNIDPHSENLLVRGNWHSTNRSKNLGGAGITIEGNHLVGQGQFPLSARQIMFASGPRP
jgi:beta-glucuronidase